jgi:acyl-CoA thioester hydrolase
MREVADLQVRKYDSEVRVIYADTDAMGIAYHTNYIKWFEVGRTEMLRQMGLPYKVLEEKGIWLPVASVACEYKSPARYDDLLSIASWVGKLGGVSMVIRYEITNKETGELLVTGDTRHGITTPALKPLRLQKEFPEIHAFFLNGVK